MSTFWKAKANAQTRHSPVHLEPLEPRLLYSADLIGGVIDGNSFESALDNELELETILPTTAETARPNDADKQEPSPARTELVVIDAATPDYQLLVDDIVNRSDSDVRLEIALLDTQQDGISQINQVLANYQQLDAIHLVSHGTEAAILLGDSLLNQQSLDQYAETLTGWQNSLSDDADLLIYGCNLAADDTGLALIEQLSTLTGADVAASDDVTGHSLLRGDWELEQQRGHIETDVAFSEEVQQSWSGGLAGPPELPGPPEPLNTPPTASDNTITIVEDSVYTFTAEDFGFVDADAGDQLFSIQITSPESVGSLIRSGLNGAPSRDIGPNEVIPRAVIDQGLLTFTPQAGGSGDSYDSFLFTVNDSRDDSDNTYTMTIDVTPNDAPVAVADSFTVGEGSSTTLDLAGNDSDADDGLDPGSITIVGAASHGSVVVNADGTVDYTHDGSETVSDSFTYTIKDTQGATSNTVTVDLVVTPVNDAPVASDDSQATGENSVLNGNVPAATDVDGTVAGYQLAGDVAEGSLTFNADGSYRFDPGSDFDDLPAGGSRDVTFSYTATDNDGGVGMANTVTITVTGTNDLPVASDDSQATGENTVLNGNVPAATDVDGTVAGYQLAGDVAEGSLTFNADGSYSFDPGSDFDDLPAGGSRDVTFSYTATDNDGGVSMANTVTITVAGTNDLPVASDDSQATGENTVLNGNVPAATDVDGTVAGYQLAGDVAEGSLTFNSDGSYSFDPGSDFDDLPAGGSRDVTFSYTATDNDGGVSGQATVTITVTGTNDLPVASDDSQATGENSLLNGNVPAATDVDGTVAGYQLAGDVAEGSLTFNSDGSYSFDPGSDFDDLPAGGSRDVTFTYTATDNDGGVSMANTVTITVTGTNDLPVASDDSQATGENTVLNGNVPAATDVDGTVAGYQLAGDVAEGSLTFNSDGSYSFDPGSDFDDLPAGGSRDVTFTYTATDNDGGVSMAKTVTITVTGTNDAPVAQDATETSEENTVLNSNVPAATDVDGTVAGYQLAGDVAEGSLTFSADGSYSFDPGSDFDDLPEGGSRDVTFSYTATDNDGGVSGPATVTITVTGTNDLPVASDDSQATGENTVLNGNVPAATDVDGTVAGYQLAGDVAEGSLTFNVDGSYSFDPGSDFDDLPEGGSRDVTFTYTATDNDGGVSMAQTVTITVTGSNDAAVVGSGDTGSIMEDIGSSDNELLETSGVLTVTDPDVGEASFQDGVIAGSYGSLTIDEAGNWSYTANNNQAVIQQLDAGESLFDVLTVTTADGSIHTVTVVINGAEDSPVIGGTHTGTVAEDGSLSVSGSLVITDMDSSDNPVAFSDEVLTAGDNGYGDFVLSGGSWTYSLNNSHAAVQALGGGQSLTDSHSFVATDGSSQVVTISITGTGDAPTASDNTVTTQEGSNYVFSTGDFGFSDIDAGDSLASIQITTLATFGSLQLSGVDASLNQIISRADIDAGRLSYTPIDNVNGNNYDSFQFTASDGTSDSVVANTILVEVTINPETEDDSPISIAPGPPETDDSPASITPVSPEADDLPTSMGPESPETEDLPISDASGISEPDESPIDNDADSSESDDQISELETSLLEPITNSNTNPNQFFPEASFEVIAGEVNGINSVQEDRINDSVTSENTALEVIDLNNLALVPIESTLAEPAQHKPVNDNDTFLHELDEMRRDLNKSIEAEEQGATLVSEVIIGGTLSLTVGVVSWVLRTGSLMASFLSVVPLWKQFDLVPILGGSNTKPQGAESGDDEVVPEYLGEEDKIFGSRDDKHG